MKQHMIVALILIPCLLFAATSKIDFEKGTDFSKYKTYAWGKAQEGDPPEQPLDANLAKAVETALAARGWTLVTGPADVILTRDLRVVADDRVTSFSSGIGSGIGMGSGDFQRAARLFAIAGVYGRFDMARVADESAHQAVAVLLMASLNELGQSAKDELQAAISAEARSMANPA